MHTRTIVTSALPYVNNIPHLGNMICIISADVYTRYLKSMGREVISVIGTDEHGAATEIKALEEGVTPKVICDTYYEKHKAIYAWFNTAFSCIGRTSSKENAQITTDIFTKLQKEGYILQKEVEQYYDTQKGMFLPDRFIEGTCPYCGYTSARGDQCDGCSKLLEPSQLIKPVSKVSKTTPILKKSEHYYIDLAKLAPLLSEYVAKHEAFWSDNAKQTARGWLGAQLEARSITRDLSWGIPVPGLPNKVFYCWFDAPIGYIGITAQNRPDWHNWWHDNAHTRLVQFMGKDNLAFHTILFPAFLLGTKDSYTLMHTVCANEFLNYADGKFSKSRGTGVFADQAMTSGIHPDAYRYYLMAIRPEAEDTVFDWSDFGQKVNGELINNYANLVNRTTSIVHQHFNGIVEASPDKLDLPLEAVHAHYEKIELKDALKACMRASSILNAYAQAQAPWLLVKTEKAKAAQVLATLLEGIAQVSLVLEPFIPQLARSVLDQLSVTSTLATNTGQLIRKGQTITLAKPLLPKIEDALLQKLRLQFMGKQQSFPLDLRVAQITQVSPHPQADKLYLLDLDIGPLGKRRIVSGLKPYFTAEELLGKQIVVIANLQKATIRGVESQGMLLAAQESNQSTTIELLTTKFSKPGDQVLADGLATTQDEVSIDVVSSCNLCVKQKQAYAMDKPLKTTKESIVLDLVKGFIR